jgi:riboflavin kinase/FMN adenylyltransferase
LTGIFAVRVHGLAGPPRNGVASVGVRPTVKVDAKPLLEVFMLDFANRSMGGASRWSSCTSCVRERFADSTLSQAIERDVVEAREYFAARG